MRQESGHIGIGAYLSRRLLPLSAAVGLLIALLAPTTYYLITHHEQQRQADLHAEELAGKFRDLALEAPELWKYQSYKFMSITEGYHPTLELLGFSVLDEMGRPLSNYQYLEGGEKYGEKLNFADDLRYTVGSAPIIFNNRRVGTVQALFSDARCLQAAALLFAVSSLVGLCITVVVYLFPLKVVRRAEEELKRVTEFSRTVLDSTDDAVSIIDVGDFRVVGGNAQFFRSIGITEAQLAGSKCYELTHGRTESCCGPEDGSCPLRQTVRTGGYASAEHTHILASGKRRYVEVATSPVFDEQGKVAQVVHVTRDITDRKMAEVALKEAETKFRSLVEESLVGVYIVQDGVFRYVNPKMAQIFGYEASELVERRGPAHLVLPEDWPAVEENLRRKLVGEPQSVNYQFRGVTRGKAVIDLEVFGNQTVYQGKPAVIGTLLDVTARKRADEQIHQLAYYDPLTKLPNRRLLLDRLNQGLAQAKRAGRLLALMFLDLDNFKLINDTLGHDAGDELLKIVAHRLVGCVREADTVCRQGGDEFIVILTEIAQPQDVTRVEEKILQAIREPIELLGHELSISTSLGVAVYPSDGADSVDDLMKMADMGMYQMKQEKRGAAVSHLERTSSAAEPAGPAAPISDRELSSRLAIWREMTCGRCKVCGKTFKALPAEVLVARNQLIAHETAMALAIGEPGFQALTEACRESLLSYRSLMARHGLFDAHTATRELLAEQVKECPFRPEDLQPD